MVHGETARGCDLLRQAIVEAIQASAKLSSLSLQVKQAIAHVFTSEDVLLKEVNTHEIHPAVASKNTPASLYKVIAAIDSVLGSTDHLSSWVASNITPGMEETAFAGACTDAFASCVDTEIFVSNRATTTAGLSSTLASGANATPGANAASNVTSAQEPIPRPIRALPKRPRTHPRPPPATLEAGPPTNLATSSNHPLPAPLDLVLHARLDPELRAPLDHVLSPCPIAALPKRAAYAPGLENIPPHDAHEVLQSNGASSSSASK
ncbi:hypothetical protein EV121DRAFT_294349 [Schizophyllum commune]